MNKKGNVLIIGKKSEVEALKNYLSLYSWQVFDASNAIQGIKMMYEKPISIVIMDSLLFNPWEMNPIQLLKSTLPVVPIFVLGHVGNNLNIVKEFMIEHYFHYPWTGDVVKNKLNELEQAESA